jgi:MYXO-CTERM domain-containing protein
MSPRRICITVLVIAAAAPVASASARPVDLQGIHRRATVADLPDRSPAPRDDAFPWLEVAGVPGLVAVAGLGASTARRRRRATLSAPA